LKNGKIRYVNEELTSSVQKSRELLEENFPTLISSLEEGKRLELMLIIYLRSRKKHLRKTCMIL
jgi:hypothetical protein